MTFLQWRRFNFFDREVLKDSSNEKFDKLKDLNISVCSSGRAQIIFGDFQGNLHFLNRQLEVTTFSAYEIKVTHLHQMKQQNVLVSIGEDEEGVNPIFKVWNLDKIDRFGNPSCSRLSRAIPGNTPTPVQCFSVHENMNYMAIGFHNGSVVLYRGDVTKERHSKQKVIFEGNHPITGVSFKTYNRNSIILFISTDNRVIAMNISSKLKDHKISQVLLDNHGCNLHCAVMSDITQDHQFVIGRQDAVYFYQPDGRGPCLAFEGEKVQLHYFRSYLIVVSKESKTLARASPIGNALGMNIVTVYDIQNKFIAFTSPFPDVVDIISEWGYLFVLGGDWNLYILREKDTQTKLDMLFKKNLYDLAISLAQSQQYDQDGVIDIFRQYGDHLYSKGDHDGAIAQYIKTIGKLEASYIIRKFLDAQRIHNLTAYLQALHKAQLATVDHTTLLLNCYTKLKEVEKLDEFISTKDKDIHFDVETAIKVCRSANYYQHALCLAEQHNEHEWYLKIQIENIKDYEKALQYISKLGFYEAEKNMKKYGKVLMSEVPDETTNLLKKLCTDYQPGQGPSFKVQKANAEEFIHIFVNNSEKLIEFLEHMVKVQISSSFHIYNTLLELYLQKCVHEKDIAKKVEKERKTMELLENQDAGYDLDQALIMCQMTNFKAGILYLYEKAKLYQQILHYHMEHYEYVHIINTCKKFGCQDPHLWSQALGYFARREEDCKSEIKEVLTHIDRYNLLPPLLVIQTLAHNSTATLAVIKDYISKRIQNETDEINEDIRLINKYKEETKKMRTQILDLKNSAQIFSVAKCNICSHPLDLPSVHFLCHHSFHQSCFESYSESESECPACMPDNRKFMDIIHSQEQSRELHEQFHHQLEKSHDAFSVVTEYFGKSVFNKVTLITDPPSHNVIAASLPKDPNLQRELLMH